MTTHFGSAGGCTCCTMSRRCFLAAGAAGLAAPLVSLGAAAETPAEQLGEPVDLKAFRPMPRVTIRGVVVRHKPPYWLGWPGTSYDLDAHRQEYEGAFAQMAKNVGVEFAMDEPPLESPESVEAYVAMLQEKKPDAVMIHVQHLSSWEWVGKVASAGVPAIVFAPIGVAFTGQVLGISRQQGVHVISSMEVQAMEQAFRMIRAKKQFENTRLLVVAGDKRQETVLERLGTKVRYVPRPSLEEMFARMPETDETHDAAKEMRRQAKKVVEPSEQDLLNAARSYMAAKHLMKQEEANGITTDCLGMVTQRAVPTPPCMGACMFQDAGVTYGCEADVFGAMSLMLSSYLFDKPGFMNDPVPETVKNVLIAAHCVCGSKLNGFDQPAEPYVLRSHSESAIGVSLQVLWREGQPVTLARFTSPNEMIVDTGVVVGNVDTPPAGGCRTSVEIAMDRMEDSRDVMGFHQVVFYGNHRRDLEAFCQMNGIQVVNSPGVAPRGKMV